MSEATIGSLTTLGAVLIGWVLSEISNWIRIRRTEKQQHEAVTTALRVEADLNLDMIKEYQAILSQANPYQQDHINDDYLEQYIIHLPRWSNEIWKSQLPTIATVLEHKQLRHLTLFYYTLDHITKQWLFMEERRPTDIHRIRDIYDATNLLIQLGNPLAVNHTQTTTPSRLQLRTPLQSITQELREIQAEREQAKP